MENQRKLGSVGLSSWGRIFQAQRIGMRQDGNKDTDLLENGLEDMGKGKGKLG